AHSGAPPEAEDLTPVQHKIQAVWKEVLKLENVPLEESIYALGADSIQISRIAARLSAEGLPITARHIMRDRTIAKLASAVGGSAAEVAARPSLASFTRSGRRTTQ
ncbi:phosphopantetheine-binding protein, partial [Nostoc sp. NIES-2111]